MEDAAAGRERLPVLRVGAVVGIRPESVEQYRELHAKPWPEVRDEISRAGISNYSIFHMREMNLLFSYYEYRGHDRAADAQRMALNPAMQEWWKLCRPCQVPLAPTQGGRRWIDVDPIFFQK